MRKISTEDNREMNKIDFEYKIQCGVIYKQYLLIGSTSGVMQRRKGRSGYGTTGNSTTVYTSRPMSSGSRTSSGIPTMAVTYL